ncbi:MAG TPA: hypothetical protein PLS63_00195 [Microthrixaceae bacterium]|nr:hypothetical protein [Microthrixaceae bacterium]HPU37962.1 hypothetical protein [Microthrixaceae bacterium]
MSLSTAVLEVLVALRSKLTTVLGRPTTEFGVTVLEIVDSRSSGMDRRTSAVSESVLSGTVGLSTVTVAVLVTVWPLKLASTLFGTAAIT